MTVPDELTYERASGRIPKIMAVIGGVGTVAAFAGWGWRAGAGFLVGSLISALNFLWLKGVVDSLGGERPRRHVIILAGRFLLIAGAAYVIFSVSPISAPALWAGVFVLTAAMFVEVAIEIAYARK